MRTWVTQRFGIDVPVVGAPMAGVAGGALAGAISAAGALGCVGVGSRTTTRWVTEQAQLARATGRPFGIGLMAWALADRPELLEATLDARPDLVSVSYGDYTDGVKALQDRGITTATQVGTRDEALAAERAGVDLLVVRGGEGGGHGRADVATLPLLQEVLEVVRAPVLAAGGIATARGLAAVLAAGAEGAWVGTAFVTCTESLTTDEAAARVLAAGSSSTVHGQVFDRALRTGWPPHYGGRSLRNAFFDHWVGREAAAQAEPGLAETIQQALADRDYDTAPIYVGQAVGCVDERRDAAAVVADLAGAGDLLRRAAGRLA